MHNALKAKLAKPKRGPVTLSPIRWGKRDPDLATGVLCSVARATPRITIPFNIVLGRKLREFMQRNGAAG